MTNSWIYWAIITVISFGIWGAFSKVAVESIGWKNTTLFYTIGFVWVAPALFILYHPSVATLSRSAVIFAILAGAVSVAAIIGFNIALTTGEASIVVPVTSLYPLVTIIISLLFLHEKISFIQGAGIILAIVAITLMSM